MREVAYKVGLFFAFLLAFVLLTLEDSRGYDSLLQEYTNLNSNDVGFYWLFSGWLKFRLWLDPLRAITGRELYWFEFVVLGVLSAVMLLPRIPLALHAGSQTALLVIWKVFGEFNAHRHAIEAWSVIVAAPFLVSLFRENGGRRDSLTALVFGAVLGYFPFMRQSAIQVPVSCLILLLVAWGLDRLGGGSAAPIQGRNPARRLKPSSSPAPGSITRGARALSCFLIGFLAMQVLVPWAWQWSFGRPMPKHGSGTALLMGLGLVSNSYNAVWDDGWPLAQSLLIDGQFHSWWDLETVPGLGARHGAWFLQYILEDPLLLIRNIFWKFGYLTQFFLGTLSPLGAEFRSNGHGVGPVLSAWASRSLGIGLVGTLGGLIIYSVRSSSRRMHYLLFLLLVQIVVNLGPLIAVAPFYIGNLVALCVVAVLVFAPALWLERNTVHGEAPLRLACLPTRRLKNLIGWMLGLSVAFPGVYVGYRCIINRSEARELLTLEPAELKAKLKSLGYRFAHRFNRLNESEKEVVLGRFGSRPLGENLYFRVFAPEESPAATFLPIFGVVGDGYVGVVARFSADWKMTLPGRVSGPRNSILEMVSNGDRGLARYRGVEAMCNYTKVPDGTWDGGYWMFCLPQPRELKQKPEFLGVSAYNFKEGEEWPAGLLLDRISGGRLYRGDLISK